MYLIRSNRPNVTRSNVAAEGDAAVEGMAQGGSDGYVFGHEN